MVALLAKPTVVVSDAPFSRLNVPSLLASPVKALSVVSAVLNATSALAPFSVRSAPLPIAVMPPLANSSSASPERL